MGQFGVQKTNIFGTYGEFTVGSSDKPIKAHYLLTKIRPGSEGSWENELASQMVPWREIFNVEELTFDELIQRDLDDSRVAHDLIPYLIGGKQASAKFFPPILAVLVPKEIGKGNIKNYYPESTKTEDGCEFGNLFEFSIVKMNGDESPLGEISFNRQKTSFVIVDGQHRAMAILALHRQLNSSWGSDKYASYYAHLDVNADMIKNIELPVCVVYFPDFHEQNSEVKNMGVDLKSVCREIFLTVNKQAKKVSSERELLLDDDDFAARMMRNTLSSLKGRGENKETLSRIYSYAYGDSFQGDGGSVVSGIIEYSSAIAIHKIHAATIFGGEDAFKLDRPSDITDGRRVKNSDRPVRLLIGTELEAKWQSLSRKSGKYHLPDDVASIVNNLSRLSDVSLFKLFDEFKPFSITNAQLRKLRTRLLDPTHKSDPIQSKCYTLLFEGSGVLSVFEEHKNRLKERIEEIKEGGQDVDDYINNQFNDAKAVTSALEMHTDVLKKKRACALFNIEYERIFDTSEDTHDDKKQILAKARPIFSSISTQAFQIGYVMAINTLVEIALLDKQSANFEYRYNLHNAFSDLIIGALNSFFDSGQAMHRKIAGLINETRSDVFDPLQPGLRKVLRLSGVVELNEKQWVFFRYVILEILYSKYGRKVINDYFEDNDEYQPDFICASNLAIPGMFKLRESYRDSIVEKFTSNVDFKQDIERIKAHLDGEGKTVEEIDQEVDKLIAQKTAEAQSEFELCIQASLGSLESESKVKTALGLD